MKTLKLAPSVMCCDFLELRSQLSVFEQERIDLLHLDVMDGHFVPNLALGTDLIGQLKKNTSIPLDLHLMVEEPERLLPALPFGEGDSVSVHSESTRHLQRLLQSIRARGARAFLALNPATPVFFAEDVLEDLDGLLLMTVNPGFAGQKLIPHSIEKIRNARLFLDRSGREKCEIEVDGNVSPENGVQMRAAGANIFVAGSSGIFYGDDLARSIRSFRRTVFCE